MKKTLPFLVGRMKSGVFLGSYGAFGKRPFSFLGVHDLKISVTSGHTYQASRICIRSGENYRG
ncbi:MAG: hypothetical protein RBT63_01235 [Bdellovibrionales bacterium]|nr:hypothetical protein [Bdellovibrionales bacterium]